MEPLADDRPPRNERPRLSRRKVGLVGGGLVAVAVAGAVGYYVVGSGAPGKDEVAAELRAAISELTPAKPSGTGTARFDTAALRLRLDGAVDGWYIDLAADSGATRVGAAARALEGGTCVFAWSDVGGPQSAVVSDPRLPCVADIALIAAKPPA